MAKHTCKQITKLKEMYVDNIEAQTMKSMKWKFPSVWGQEKD